MSSQSRFRIVLLVPFVLACDDRPVAPPAEGGAARHSARDLASMQRAELPLEEVPAPEVMTRAEVEAELARRGAGPEQYEVRDFERLLRVFPLVKSHAAQQHLLGKTMPVILSRPAGARRAFFDRL